MEVTTKELRIQPGKIIAQVTVGQEVTVTYRGRPLAKIVPYSASPPDVAADSIFGMWKDRSTRKTVEEEVSESRKGRRL